MHVSDHSRVASLFFFYKVIRSGFMLLIAVEQRFCKFALFCAVHLICVLPGTSFLPAVGIGQRTEKERVPA
jgi:hypothetical protein